MAEYTFDKIEYSGNVYKVDKGSVVSVTQSLSSGTQIGSISVDGTSTILYAPSGGGGTQVKTVIYDTDDYTTINCNYDYDEIVQFFQNGLGVAFYLLDTAFDVVSELHISGTADVSSSASNNLILECWSPSSYSNTYDDLLTITHTSSDVITCTGSSSALQTAVNSKTQVQIVRW